MQKIHKALAGVRRKHNTPELHCRLALQAPEANVSLNTVVNDQLAKS